MAPGEEPTNLSQNRTRPGVDFGSETGSRAVGLPTGSRDVLPAEADELCEIESRLRRSFSAFGYREVRTPALELDAVIERAEGPGQPAYRLFDDRGRLLTLRPDPTVPVARLVATRMADAPEPIRVCYLATAFRPPTPGRSEEIELRQAGVELVGADGAAADAEVVAVLWEALRATGLAEFRIALGSVAIVEAALVGLAIDSASRARLMAALRGRNHVAWRALAAELDFPASARALLSDLPGLRGDADVLHRLVAEIPAAAPSAEAIESTLELLRRHGVGTEVVVDLGVAREHEYYSGIVIEAFARGVGSPIAMGGRYESVAARFGRDRPAVGVAVDISALHRALVAAGAQPSGPRPGVVLVGGLAEGIEAAREGRAEGLTVVGAPGDEADARALADAEGWRFVARQDGDGFSVLDASTGETFRTDDLAGVGARLR